MTKTLNLIWTVSTGSLFLLSVESKRFFLKDGMKFVLKDYDKIGKDDVLAIVKVEPKVLYNADGEQMEFKLQPPHGSKYSEVPGILVVRCCCMSEYDQKFMFDLRKKSVDVEKIVGIAQYNAPEATTNVFKTMTTKVKKWDKETGIVRVRVSITTHMYI